MTTLTEANQISPELGQELRDVAHALADVARPEALKHFRQKLEVTNKLAGEGFDPVTVADRAAEKAMRDYLAQYRPDDAILGEEYGTRPGTTGLTWVLDPIDGTRGFICGTPTWGVLVSVEVSTGPVFGIIDQPYIGERFSGGLGIAEVRGPTGQTALGVQRTTALDHAKLLTTFPEVGTPEEGAAFQRVARTVRLTRYGMDCYGYALLAAGQVDLVIEAGLQAYDISAPVAVIEAAGGVITNWEGGAVHAGGRALAAATPELHKAAMQLLNAG